MGGRNPRFGFLGGCENVTNAIPPQGFAENVQKTRGKYRFSGLWARQLLYSSTDHEERRAAHLAFCPASAPGAPATAPTAAPCEPAQVPSASRTPRPKQTEDPATLSLPGLCATDWIPHQPALAL